MQDYIIINPADNVAVALLQLKKGTKYKIGTTQILLLEDVPPGHKFSLIAIPKDNPILKYGYSIGVAKEDILAGQHVHTHNISTGLSGLKDYTYEPSTPIASSPHTSRTFSGYKRENGDVGIRNDIWLIPTVGCINGVVASIVNQAKSLGLNTNCEIMGFPHPHGCSQMGIDLEYTQKILGNFVNHPNAGGVLVVGLGCEYANIDVFKDYIGEYNADRVKFLQCQDYEDEVTVGVNYVKELVAYAESFTREEVNVEHLVVGLKCGGSDGFSGITANPTVGGFSDLLVAHGGTTILTEVPEMFGAETILMNRCKNKTIFDKTVSLINDFKSYLMFHKQTIYENPSPGNKKGGISTLEDKSLGCTQKSGKSPVMDVINYGDKVNTKGLNLYSSPSNDLVASTAIASAGAHIVLFTTGRGTPFACPVPTVKLSTNPTLSAKKDNWIDFDCGKILTDISIEEMSELLFEYVINVANGQKVKSEVLGYQDIAIFKQGVTL